MIRPYQAQDKLKLIEIIQLNTPEYFSIEEEADFLEYLEQHREDYFVIEVEGVIAGCGGVNYFEAEGIARFSWQMLHPDFHGKRLGTQLSLHRIETIKKNPKIKRIVVRTTQLVYPFYEKLGFVFTKREKDYWAKGFDLYQLEMDL